MWMFITKNRGSECPCAIGNRGVEAKFTMDHHFHFHFGPAQCDPFAQLNSKLDQIMSKESDLIAAASTLSTAADALSVRVDTLIAKADAVVTALQGADLPPDGETALAALKASTAGAATAGDKVDAEVAKLDGVLPTPAPAAPAAPAA